MIVQELQKINKLKHNNSEIIPVDKSNSVVIIYTNNIQTPLRKLEFERLSILFVKLQQFFNNCQRINKDIN